LIIFKNINFITDKGFLNLISSNGIKHKSKEINISWVDIPIKNPKTIERIVFGPFASYESAKKQAEILKDKGFETTVAYPKNWEVWIPFEEDLPKFELKKYSSLGKKIYLMHGNRDFLLGDKFCDEIGGVLLDDPTTIKINDFFVLGQEKMRDFDNSIYSFVGC